MNALDPRNPQLKIGDLLHGFKIESIQSLEKLGAIFYLLTHQKTGAKLIHLSLEDDNNLFGVAFPTTPQDSTGVAHILEHTALCGGEHYPVRDPFFSMIKRSLKTFMNAFTASDWTMYPFATQNRKDYYNLMQVYLDAAFFPRLTQENFLQEGHRLEFEEMENPESPLVYKGVVYNEMKGAMSTQSSIMHRSLGEALFPTLTYRHNSGGDPAKIVELTHEQLKAFHQTHYHPSNSFFYTYGDWPLAERLEVIERFALARFDRIETHTAVGREERFPEPQNRDFTYPLDAAEDDGARCQFLLAWLCCDIQDSLEVLTLQVLSQVLLGTSASPLRKKLMESKLGKQLADGTGYAEDIRETYFAVGLQGVKPEDFEAVEDLIFDTLIDVIAKGIPQTQIDAAIHQMELDVREISGGHYPYSLNLLFRFFGAWMHGGDPIAALDFDKNLALFREKLAQGRYLEEKIKQYLMENHHRVRLTLQPDHHLQEAREREIQEHLAQLKAGLSAEQKNQIVEQAKKLEALQESEEDLSILPTLELTDVPAQIKYLAPTATQVGGKDLTFYERATNGIFYLNLYFPMPDLSLEEQRWLPLMASLLTGTGPGDFTYDQMAELVSLYTGGFSAGPSIEQRLAPAPSCTQLELSTKALERNLDKMLDLLELYLKDWNFREADRIQSLVKQRANALVNSINSSGHQYAASLASRGLSPALEIEENYDGIAQVQFMRELAKLEAPELLQRLEPFKAVLKKILRTQNLSVLAVGSQSAFDSIAERLQKLFVLLPEPALEPARLPEDRQPSFVSEAWTTSTPVSYVAKVIPVPRYGAPESPKLAVLATLLKANFLHGEIREKGGAYGGMAGYNSNEGLFTLMSYRDPNLARTVDVFDRALAWVKSGKFTDEELKEAILQCISSLDTPLSPAGKATSEYKMLRRGRTPELRQAYREGILRATKAEIMALGEQWLAQPGSLCAVTSAEMLEKEKGILQGRLQPHNI